MFLKKLDQHLLEALEDIGFESPTKVQKSSISKIKSGADLIVRADEKSGKSSTIAISVIQQLKSEFEDVPRAIVVVASREKAIEMKEQFLELGKNTDLRVFSEGDAGNLLDLRDKVYAGSDVVIATAKKFNELYSNSGINLNRLKMFIVDDAEMIMRDQILSEINRLSPYIPKSQRIVFCSKITKQMGNFSEEYMNFPAILDIT
nr:DEAD/DEAH box helicase [uncultured Marinifilum sp.]